MPGMRQIIRYIAALLALLPAHAADCCKDSVAVVETLSGRVTQNHVAVSNLEWLAKGATLDIGLKSNATVILLSGRRFELGSGAQATVTADALTDTKGPIKELKPLPPIPAPAPLADRSATASGAVRFRGPNDVRNLYPREGMTAIADSINLTYSPVADASAYRVEIQDEDGNSVANWQTTATRVAIPGMLKPGSHYSWHVRAIGRAGIIGNGSASFVTLTKQETERRTSFFTAIRQESAHATALGLMAGLDFRIGLLHEAQEGLQAALKLQPGDAGLQRALHLVEAALVEKPE